MTRRPTTYFFDFDGVVTAEESFALLDRTLGLGGALARQTMASCRTDADPEQYAAGLLRRLKMLEPYAVGRIAEIVGGVALRPEIERFIRENASRCVVLSSNLDIFCLRGIERRLGCRAILSHGATTADGRLDLSAVALVDKADAIERARREGMFTVMIGDSANDVEALRAADVSVAAAFSPALSAEAERVAMFAPPSPTALVEALLSLEGAADGGL